MAMVDISAAAELLMVVACLLTALRVGLLVLSRLAAVSRATPIPSLRSKHEREARGGGKQRRKPGVAVGPAGDGGFRALYKTLSSQEMGFFGEPPLFPTTGALGQIVALADDAPRVYAERDAARTRALIRDRLAALGPTERVLEALGAAPRREQAGIFAALVYVRHMFHQGDPCQPPVQTATAMEDGQEVPEPEAIGQLMPRLETVLGVSPYLNLTNWIFFNWHLRGGPDRAEALQMRFSWFRGDAQATEANFWRAFAVSELAAAPMYEQVATLFESRGDDAQMIACLRNIQTVIRKIRRVFTDSVTPQLIDVDHFNRLQNTAHFGMASAGAGGFQLPFILVLDALLGLDFARMPAKTQQVWEENYNEVQAPMRSLVADVVRPQGRLLREHVRRSSCAALQDAFNDVVKEFVLWRATHRSRASQWLHTSSVTTGRVGDDMENDVKGTFMKEMDHLIQSTRGCMVDSKEVPPSPQKEASRPPQPDLALGAPLVRVAVESVGSPCPFAGQAAQGRGVCPFASRF